MDFVGSCRCLLVYLMSTTKTGLVPQEDQGVIMVNVSISPGSTLEETTKVMDRLENILKDTPEIEHYAAWQGMDLYPGRELLTVQSLSA